MNERLSARHGTHVKVALEDRERTAGARKCVGTDTRQMSALSKTHRQPKRLEFDRVVLLLQGGGALGAYQAGVYEALAEANLHPDWVAGISIGAINAA
jgi:Patatin-like phospholipase